MKKRILGLLILFMVICMPQTVHAETLASTIVSDAESYVGKLPYVYGGTSLTTGADCSGFVCAIYAKYGYNLWAYRTQLSNLPSTIATGVTNNINYALPGDIITMIDGGVKHVGIYAGNGYLINAANQKQGTVKKPYHYYGSIYAITRINGVVQTISPPAPSDTTAPTISDVRVTDISANGYTVICKVEDSSGVARVQFPTWTTAGDQDDLMANWWDNPSCRGIQNGTTWSYRVNVSDHNYEEGYYNTHIYAWDTAGNSNSVNVNGIYVDRTPPVISDVQFESINGKLRYYCNVFEDGASTAAVNIKTDAGNNRDYTLPIINGMVSGYIHWQDFEMDSNNFKVTVSVTDIAGNVGSKSSSIDTKTDATVMPLEPIILKVGESYQYSTQLKGIFKINEERWYISMGEKSGVEISENGLVTALQPGEYLIEYYLNWTKNNDDTDDNIIWVTGSTGFTMIPRQVSVELPTPQIKTLTSDTKGNVNLSIQKVAGAESYEIVARQSVDGAEGEEIHCQIEAGKNTHVFSGLSDGSVWTYKIRACCTVGGKPYYSHWSDEVVIQVINLKITEKEDTGKEPIVVKSENIHLSKTSVTWNGKAQTPSVTVKDSQGKIIASNNYTVTYSNNKNVGQATVTINFKNGYIGTIKKTFTIKPKGTSISKVSAIKKGFTVKWKKQKSQTTGYEIQYSTSSKFKGTKTLKNIKVKVTSKKVTKLKAKKKYYVRIRTYKTVKVNGKSTKMYSEWSKAKSVVTKK